MSSIIGFLESAGRRPMSSLEFAAGIEDLDVALDAKQALLERDSVALNHLLGGRAQMCCMILANEPTDH